MFLNRKLKYWSLALIVAIDTVHSNAFAQAQGGGQAQSPMQSFGFFLPLIVVFLIFYMLIIRPQQKQAKQRQAMIAAVKKGDLVVTTGGIHGRVVGVTENILTVEIADNCKVKVERSGIQTVKSSESENS